MNTSSNVVVVIPNVLVDMNNVPIILNTLPATITNTAVVAVDVVPYAKNTVAHIEDDYAFTRSKHYEIIRSGMKSLEELTTIATASQHMRAYEAIAMLIKTMSESSDALLKNQMMRQELQAEEEDRGNAVRTSDNGMVSVNNAIFVGTTKDLLELKKAK